MKRDVHRRQPFVLAGDRDRSSIHARMKNLVDLAGSPSRLSDYPSTPTTLAAIINSGSATDIPLAIIKQSLAGLSAISFSDTVEKLLLNSRFRPGLLITCAIFTLEIYRLFTILGKKRKATVVQRTFASSTSVTEFNLDSSIEIYAINHRGLLHGRFLLSICLIPILPWGQANFKRKYRAPYGESREFQGLGVFKVLEINPLHSVIF